MRLFYILFLVALTTLVSCFKDKGNYDYKELATITFSNVEKEYNLMGNVERLVISPKVTSSQEGEIKANNSNFEFEYFYNVYNKETERYWTPVSKGLTLDTLALFQAGTYQFLLVVKDKRTGISTFQKTKVVIGSPTYEGWMLLGTTGENKKTRLDMISVLSSTRDAVAIDVMASRGLPAESKGAYGFGFYPNYFSSTMDKMYLSAEGGTYLLEKNEFKTSTTSTINFTDFISSTELKDDVAKMIFNGNMLLVTAKGDAYAQILGMSGARFQDKINTLVRGGATSFKVAPFIGYNAKRPNITSSLGIFFDLNNKRFLGWSSNTLGGGAMFVLNNPSGADYKFDYNTNSELLHMEGTGFDGGVAYAVLKDNKGAINVAAMLATSNDIKQHSYYENIDAPNIKQATKFAFHSIFPIMFYSVGSDIYCYNLGTKASNKVLTLPGEEVTVLQFHPFKGTLGGIAALNKDDEEFMNLPNRLNISSYKIDMKENGGHFRIYNIDAPTLSISPYKSYDGLCRIADIMYRERRAQYN